MNPEIREEVYRLYKFLSRLGKPWAFSGSIAMALHALQASVELHRETGDIDIVVGKSDMEYVTTQIVRNLKYRYADGPPPLWGKLERGRGLDHVELVRDLDDGRDIIKIDILLAGSELAPALQQSNIVYVHSIPIIKLSSLLKQKKMTLQDYKSEKALKNLEFIMTKLRMDQNKFIDQSNCC